MIKPGLLGLKIKEKKCISVTSFIYTSALISVQQDYWKHRIMSEKQRHADILEQNIRNAVISLLKASCTMQYNKGKWWGNGVCSYLALPIFSRYSPLPFPLLFFLLLLFINFCLPNFFDRSSSMSHFGKGISAWRSLFLYPGIQGLFILQGHCRGNAGSQIFTGQSSPLFLLLLLLLKLSVIGHSCALASAASIIQHDTLN